MDLATLLCMSFNNENPKTYKDLPWHMKHSSMKTWIMLFGDPDKNREKPSWNRMFVGMFQFNEECNTELFQEGSPTVSVVNV